MIDPDAVFAALVAAHDDLDEAQSRRLDARLLLDLARLVPAEELARAIQQAREAL